MYHKFIDKRSTREKRHSRHKYILELRLFVTLRFGQEDNSGKEAESVKGETKGITALINLVNRALRSRVPLFMF